MPDLSPRSRPFKRLALVTLAVAGGLVLSACDGSYGGGTAVGWGAGPYAYNGWYDDYYGPIHDGYWGTDNVFWYRSSPGDRYYRRGDRAHFRRDMPAPIGGGGRGWRQFQGTIPDRPAGVRMPHFRHGH